MITKIDQITKEYKLRIDSEMVVIKEEILKEKKCDCEGGVVGEPGPEGPVWCQRRTNKIWFKKFKPII